MGVRQWGSEAGRGRDAVGTKARAALSSCRQELRIRQTEQPTDRPTDRPGIRSSFATTAAAAHKSQCSMLISAGIQNIQIIDSISRGRVLNSSFKIRIIIRKWLVIWCLPADRHSEDFTPVSFDYGGHWPGDADTKEDVDGVTTRHIADRSIGVLVLNGGHFAGKRIWCCVALRCVALVQSTSASACVSKHSSIGAEGIMNRRRQFVCVCVLPTDPRQSFHTRSTQDTQTNATQQQEQKRRRRKTFLLVDNSI